MTDLMGLSQIRSETKYVEENHSFLQLHCMCIRYSDNPFFKKNLRLA